MTTQEILQQARQAKLPLALADTDTKDAALEEMAVALVAAKEEILEANRRDLDAARGKISDVMLDRLALTPNRLPRWRRACAKWPPCPTLSGLCCARSCGPTAC